MMLSMGETEALILLVVVLLFWAKRIPELAKSISSGVREFRRGVSDRDDSEPVKEREEREKLPEAKKAQTEIGDNTFAGRGAF
jgi:TatA/E family protein of Tat protein translocase